MALAGTAVRLRSATGAESVVLASYLMAAPDFAVTGTEPLPVLEPFGLLGTLPEPARAAAVEWQRHVVEVGTGLPPGAGLGTPARDEYDPATRSLTERMRAKATELDVSLRTMEGKRSRYMKQALGGWWISARRGGGRRRAGRMPCWWRRSAKCSTARRTSRPARARG
ncbi:MULTISPECIES: hypothetical protein [unclassified Streptomyces]|uniref:hypothetical protein n=1 Tax=unclassified Streptomyces TaxID=2593676 RepID=UPI0035D854A6